jgi:hypothetical protein
MLVRYADVLCWCVMLVRYAGALCWCVMLVRYDACDRIQ